MQHLHGPDGDYCWGYVAHGMYCSGCGDHDVSAMDPVGALDSATPWSQQTPACPRAKANGPGWQPLAPRPPPPVQTGSWTPGCSGRGWWGRRAAGWKLHAWGWTHCCPWSSLCGVMGAGTEARGRGCCVAEVPHGHGAPRVRRSVRNWNGRQRDPPRGDHQTWG